MNIKMLDGLHDLALRYKIALLAGLPLLALLALGISDVLHYRTLQAEAERFDDLVGLSVLASDLVDELQKERGASAGFLGSGGERFRDTVETQRELADERRMLYVARADDVASGPVDPAIGAHLAEIDAALGGLPRLRSDVDALRIGVADEVARYTTVVSALLDISGVLMRHAPDRTLANEGTAFATLLQSKEKSGLERALLANVFAKDTVSAAELDRFTALANAQTAYLNMFLVVADDEHRALFAERMTDPAIAAVERMRRALVARGTDGGFGVDPEQWFETATQRIAVLGGIGKALAEDLGERAAAVVAASAGHYRLVTLLVVCAAALSLLFVVLVSRSVLDSIRAAVTLAETVSRGDLTLSPAGKRHRDEPGRLLQTLDDTRDHLQTVIGSAQRVAVSVQAGSSSIRDGQTSLSARTDEQAISLEDTSSSMEEISTTTKNNAASAERADRLAREARERAATGKDVVDDAVVAMRDINEASRRIENIIGVIDEIAFQTNLLALNAAVEAARAGEQGRGFAVVASEVRQLAGRSASAAKEIKDLIQDSVHKVESGAGLVNRSGQTLEELVASITSVSELITDIAGASREQAIGVDRIHDALTRIDGITQQNLALVQTFSATSERMEREAGELAAQLSFFTVRAEV